MGYGDLLFDFSQGRNCKSDSFSTTAAKVYQFLQFQEEAFDIMLENLLYLNKQSTRWCGSDFVTKHSVFLYKLDVVTLLYSYLDELFEYCALFCCCLHEKSWIAVFFRCIQVELGTNYCKVLFAALNAYGNFLGNEFAETNIFGYYINEIGLKEQFLVGQLAKNEDILDYCKQMVLDNTFDEFQRLIDDCISNICDIDSSKHNNNDQKNGKKCCYDSGIACFIANQLA